MQIKLIKSAKQAPKSAILIDLINNNDEGFLYKKITENILLINYKTENSTSKELIFAIITNEKLDVQRIQQIVEGIVFAKQIATFPPNLFYPIKLAEYLKELSSLGIEVQILDEKALKKIGMGALLAAGQGSKHAPAVAILKWKGRKSTKTPPIALVGKGVTFDSGGLCLKKTADQKQMKMDKSGAGVVAGAIKTLASLQCPIPVVGVLGFLENMPDGNAVKPGDVIKTYSSKTVEIMDTDAEGRLLLADCLSYAIQTFSPSVIIDMGTLTKETSCSLGAECAGLYSNDLELEKSLLNASRITGERLWPLPMGPYFSKQIESPIADLKNCGLDGCGENGACAEFLKAFVGSTKWAHIDLSMASWNDEGATGFGVHCLVEWIFSTSHR